MRPAGFFLSSTPLEISIFPVLIEAESSSLARSRRDGVGISKAAITEEEGGFYSPGRRSPRGFPDGAERVPPTCVEHPRII